MFTQKNRTRRYFMKKGVVSLAIIILLTLSAVAFLIYNLETYYEFVHGDQSTLVCAYTIFIALVTGLIYMTRRNSFRSYKTVYAVCSVILFLVFLLGRRIPFCVECEQTTARELGILRFWIKPFEGLNP